MQRYNDGKNSTQSGKEIQLVQTMNSLAKLITKPLYEVESESDWDSTSEEED